MRRKLTKRKLLIAPTFPYREYPCDHYTSVITVTMVISGCPRVDIQATALQLLQLLDKRFFGTVGLLQSDKEKGKTREFPHSRIGSEANFRQSISLWHELPISVIDMTEVSRIHFWSRRFLELLMQYLLDDRKYCASNPLINSKINLLFVGAKNFSQESWRACHPSLPLRKTAPKTVSDNFFISHYITLCLRH